MKYIKTYEKLKEFSGDFNFKPGDVVVCVVNRGSKYVAKYGEKYIVKEVKGYGIALRYFKIDKFLRISKEKNQGYSNQNPGKIKYFYSGNFVPEYVWNTKKYNL